MEVKIPGVQLLRKRSDRGDLISAQTNSKLPTTITMSNLWKASLQQATQSGMTTALGLLKSGKTDIETYERSGRPDKMSWRMIRKVRPGHEEIRLDGTAQSVRNEETPRERSERPDIDSQEEKRQDLNNSSLQTMKQNWNCQ